MIATETAQASRNRPLGEQLQPLNSMAWNEEIEEVRACVGEAAKRRRDDPDWQAARRFLARHCERALGNSLFTRPGAG